jgi:crossover junction endodeoxyribonuclease RuvC
LKKIFGLDPGTATTGFAIVEKTNNNLQAIDFGVITTSPRFSLSERIVQLVTDFRKLLKIHQPDIIAIESLFFFKNQKTAFAVAQARGALLFSAAEFGAEICEPTPLQVKQSVTSYGRANKEQVQKMVQQIYGFSEIPKPDDAADALAVAFYASSKLIS